MDCIIISQKLACCYLMLVNIFIVVVKLLFNYMTVGGMWFRERGRISIIDASVYDEDIVRVKGWHTCIIVGQPSRNTVIDISQQLIYLRTINTQHYFCETY